MNRYIYETLVDCLPSLPLMILTSIVYDPWQWKFWALVVAQGIAVFTYKEIRGIPHP